jgi:rsbT antagonist protein RsbS
VSLANRPVDIPIFKQGEVLIVTFQPAIHDESLVRLRTALVQEVVRRRSRGVIVDVTSMEVMDSFSARILQEIAHIIRLRGAETVIVGIQPEVAFAMVQLGLRLENVVTALDLEEGMAYLSRKFTTT